jgi:hypothetical protein
MFRSKPKLIWDFDHGASVDFGSPKAYIPCPSERTGTTKKKQRRS